MTGTIIAIETSISTLAEAEHLLLGLDRVVDLIDLNGLLDGTTLCTHEVRNGAPHYAFTIVGSSLSSSMLNGSFTGLAEHFGSDSRVAIDEPPPDCPGLAQAITAARTRSAGRAVRFSGCEQLVGTVTVAEALAHSAIDRLSQLGGGAVGPEQLLHTRDFVRPRFIDGDLVLAVMPGPNSSLAPFEVPNPTPCCSEHR